METKVKHLTSSEFKEKVFDYENNTEWKYNGTLPCIVDFYASWCGPCKTIAPILDELSIDYDGKVLIYKVDTEDEYEVASVFSIRSIPSILFVPVDGDPQMSNGAMSKESFEKAIKSIFNI